MGREGISEFWSDLNDVAVVRRPLNAILFILNVFVPGKLMIRLGDNHQFIFRFNSEAYGAISGDSGILPFSIGHWICAVDLHWVEDIYERRKIYK